MINNIQLDRVIAHTYSTLLTFKGFKAMTQQEGPRVCWDADKMEST